MDCNVGVQVTTRRKVVSFKLKGKFNAKLGDIVVVYALVGLWRFERTNPTWGRFAETNPNDHYNMRRISDPFRSRQNNFTCPERKRKGVENDLQY